MSKVNRAYPHLLGGVSERPIENRAAGEHWVQDNFITHKDKGLVRRAGARLMNFLEDALPYTAVNMTPRTRTYDFQVGPSYFSVVYDTGLAGGVNRLCVFNKTNGQLVPVTHASDANTLALLNGGITSATALGRYVVMAGPGLTPTYTTTEQFGVASNLKHHVAWIRGGAFSRRFRVALIRGNQKLWCEYTTPSAGYPEPLDTSGLNENDPDYLKQVNDLTNQYNSAVNAWIAAALEAAQPESIARTLAEEITNSGFLGSGETAEANGPNVYISAQSVEDIEVEDGGDGSLARGVGNTVAAAELLSLYHIPGKIVRVRPNNSSDGQCFYMEALAKDGSTGQLTEVSWRECAGTKFTPTVVFGVLAVNDAGNAAYFDTDLANLRSEAAEFSTLPSYTASAAGDADSNPPQRFLGEAATGLTTFQDRLVVLCGPAVNSSKTSDYFNFFRASIVTVAADDPVNFVAIGGEDDVLRYALTYDRNLVLWGTGQYIVDGRKPFSPGTVSAVRMASIKDALIAAPVLGDEFIFFGREREDGTGSVYHLQPGRIQEAPESHELSAGLVSYIQGAPVEISVCNDPDYLYVRSSGDNSLKVYAYRDAANGERVLSAWSRWTFDSAAGELVGVSVLNGAVYLLFYKDTGTGRDAYLGRVSPDVGDEPYMDLWAQVGAATPQELVPYTVAAQGEPGGYAGISTAIDVDPGYVPAAFSYTGSVQSYVVPADTAALEYKAWGAGGGSANDGPAGGGGGFVSGTLAVVPGETLTIVIGEAGSNGGVGAGGGGGGATAIRRQGSALAVAGGGGGGGLDGAGGAAGGTAGLPGSGTASGGGGTLTAAGAGGFGATAAGDSGVGGEGGDGGGPVAAAGGTGWGGGGDGGEPDVGAPATLLNYGDSVKYKVVTAADTTDYSSESTASWLTGAQPISNSADPGNLTPAVGVVVPVEDVGFWIQKTITLSSLAPLSMEFLWDNTYTVYINGVDVSAGLVTEPWRSTLVYVPSVLSLDVRFRSLNVINGMGPVANPCFAAMKITAPTGGGGGGGGGGWRGGGGGATSGGGGGSSKTAAGGTSTAGSGSTPGASADADRSGAGAGAVGAGAATHGRVVFTARLFPAVDAYNGLQFDAKLIPSSPFATDRDGLPILQGRTTVNQLQVGVKHSSGLRFVVQGNGWPESVGAFSAQWSGDAGTSTPPATIWAASGVNAIPDEAGNGTTDGAFSRGELRLSPTSYSADPSVIPSMPPVDGSASIPVGRETRDYKVVLSSFGFGPLTISSLTWTGQLFYRARRL